MITEAEKYYHSLLKFGVRPGLGSTKDLLSRLGEPQKALRVIHVAGTNGKGTVCSFLASVLTRAGYKTGLYTSPYIVDFRERIRVDGEMIPENELDGITEAVREQVEKMRSDGITVTEFEAVTAAALLYYKKRACDFVVLETGLGGRFDATNVIESPIVSVITSISLDHTKILGDTISQIAYEKCGIIKKGCASATVSTQKDGAMRVIRESAREKGSDLYIADMEKCEVISDSVRGSEMIFNGHRVFSPFPGKHQTENCALALTAVDIMRKKGIAIGEDAVEDGIKNTKNPARCEIISEKPLVIFDGCHNEASAQALCEVMGKYLADKKITAVMGMMSDKDVDKVLSLLLPRFDKAYTATVRNQRSLKAGELAEKIKALGYCAESCDNAAECYELALSNLKDDGALIVCGSLYLCSELYPTVRE